MMPASVQGAAVHKAGQIDKWDGYLLSNHK